MSEITSVVLWPTQGSPAIHLHRRADRTLYVISRNDGYLSLWPVAEYAGDLPTVTLPDGALSADAVFWRVLAALVVRRLQEARRVVVADVALEVAA